MKLVNIVAGAMITFFALWAPLPQHGKVMILMRSNERDILSLSEKSETWVADA